MKPNPFFGREMGSIGVMNLDSKPLRSTVKVSGVAVPDVWRERTEIIYEFLARQTDYEQLCLEVAYVLKRKLKEKGIEVSSITYRAKDLNSFLEKLSRKFYKDPFKEITDFAGVRVVCLYSSDLHRIEEVIRQEFEVIEKVDKYKENSSDRFGYMAVHFLVKLGDEFSGARYDHLKNLVCEIQTRTILQHAWALIDQHLVYKKKSSVPEELRQRIIQLSKVLEEADRQVEMIRQIRMEYIKSLKEAQSQDAFLSQEINIDSFRAFCERAFPNAEPEDDIRTFERFLKWIDTAKYKSIGDLEKAVKKAKPYLNQVKKDLEEMLRQQGRSIEKWTNLLLVHISLAISDEEYRKTAGISRDFQTILEKNVA